MNRYLLSVLASFSISACDAAPLVSPPEFNAVGVEQAIRTGNPVSVYPDVSERRDDFVMALPIERLMGLLRDDPQFDAAWRPRDRSAGDSPRSSNPVRDEALNVLSHRVHLSRKAGAQLTSQQMEQLVPLLIQIEATDKRGLNIALSSAQMPEHFVTQIEDLFAARIRSNGVGGFASNVPHWLTDSRKVVADAMLDAIKHPTLGLRADDESLKDIDPVGQMSADAAAALPPDRLAKLHRNGREARIRERMIRLSSDVIRVIGAERLLEQAEAEATPADDRAAIAAALWQLRNLLWSRYMSEVPAKYDVIPATLGERIRAAFRREVIESDVPLTHGLANEMLGRMIYGFDTPEAVQLGVDDPGRRAEAQAIRAMFEAKPQRLDVSRGRSGGRENLKPKFDQLVAEQPEPGAR